MLEAGTGFLQYDAEGMPVNWERQREVSQLTAGLARCCFAAQ